MDASWISAVRGLTLGQPWWLLLLLVLPVVAWWRGRPGPAVAVPFPSLTPLRALGLPPRRRRGRWHRSLILLTLGAIIVALARPRVPWGEIPDPSKGIDIMVVVDFSSSMTIKDFHLAGRRVTRREALLQVVGEFLAKRPQDRVGILGFARGPFLVSPLTLDHGWALEALSQVEQSSGSAIGEAIVAATHFLSKASPRGKVVILVSDGENSAGRKPLEVVAYPKREGVRVHSIVIGPDVLRGARLANHELLQVSRITGGQLFQATDTRALQAVYEAIDRIEKRTLLEKRMVRHRELFPWLTGLALAVFAGELGLHQIARRRWP